MRFQKFSFGAIRIDGVTYEHDVVIDRGDVRKRKKKPSKKFRDEFGHTPVSVEEKIPWQCRQLIIGTGTGALPVMDDVRREARRRKIALLVLPTIEAIQALKEHPEKANAILHVTCCQATRQAPPPLPAIDSARPLAPIMARSSHGRPRSGASRRSRSRVLEGTEL